MRIEVLKSKSTEKFITPGTSCLLEIKKVFNNISIISYNIIEYLKSYLRILKSILDDLLYIIIYHINIFSYYRESLFSLFFLFYLKPIISTWYQYHPLWPTCSLSRCTVSYNLELFYIFFDVHIPLTLLLCLPTQCSSYSLSSRALPMQFVFSGALLTVCLVILAIPV